MKISNIAVADSAFDHHTQRTLIVPIIGTVTVSLMFVFGCNIAGSDSASNQTPPGQMRELTAQEQVLVDGTNDFTFDILHEIAEDTPDKSFFASPLSISMAFGMALNGTDGDTYVQMQDFFGHEGLSNDEINQAFKDLVRLLTQLDPQVRMEIANSVWYRKGFEVLQEFLATNAEYFDAEIAALDFSDPGAPDIINAWIEEKTEGLIEEMIDEIGGDVVMYLINAIYFKADWTIQFDPDYTRDQLFTTGTGDQVEVPMMRVKDEFRYYRNDDWQVVDLGYGEGGDFSFTAYLPGDSENLSDFAGSLSRQEFESFTSRLEADTVEVHMPRFEIDFDYEEIMADLMAMGLTFPFYPNIADFSRINPNVPLYISDVMHRAVIKVDEEGSEAAAATVIEISIDSAGPSHPVIRLDRPFLFFIRENSSDTILFMGKYAGPEA